MSEMRVARFASAAHSWLAMGVVAYAAQRVQDRCRDDERVKENSR